ncbi:hypothetical protein OH76DRAFT_1404717 [Lentinus brumalis]|uniref:Uncharacterized protein n=1 Tax=Lentinus brumalis TaxID=2498619 RepID=A0A371D7C9_9APHY|nr:hypothetical protein OH76DRAFT_1404717 [Polyporus brumalis]
MSNLFRPREYVAHYNVQTQNYLGLRRGLPVYAPIPGNHVVGEVGYLLQGGICVIPRQLAPHAEDKLSSNPSPGVEDAKNNSTSCSEVQAAQDKNAEQRATCGGAECGEEVLGEDDTLTVYDSEFCPDADSSLATSLRRDADVVQLQSEDGNVLDAFVIFPYDPSKEIAGEDAEPSKKVPDKDCLDDCGNESDDTSTLCPSEAADGSAKDLQLSVDDVRRLFKLAPQWNKWANSVDDDAPGMEVKLKDMVLICGVQSTWCRNTNVSQDALEAALSAHATANDIPLDPKAPDILENIDMSKFSGRRWLVHEQTFVQLYKIRRRRSLPECIQDVTLRAWDWITMGSEDMGLEKPFDPVNVLLRYILLRIPFAQMAIASTEDFFALFKNASTIPTTTRETWFALLRLRPSVRFIKGTWVAALEIACLQIERETALACPPGSSDKLDRSKLSAKS